MFQMPQLISSAAHACSARPSVYAALTDVQTATFAASEHGAELRQQLWRVGLILQAGAQQLDRLVGMAFCNEDRRRARARGGEVRPLAENCQEGEREALPVKRLAIWALAGAGAGTLELQVCLAKALNQFFHIVDVGRPADDARLF